MAVKVDYIHIAKEVIEENVASSASEVFSIALLMK